MTIDMTTELELLKEENSKLRQKLKIAEGWMQKEVREQVRKMSKRKVSRMTSDIKDSFMQENIEDTITNKINKFFGQFILMNTPVSIIDNIITGEINYYNLRQNPNLDGFAVISSYHKALDAIIESTITKGFRKFSKKQNQINLFKNDPLEKTLHLVVNKGYILSTGRLFHLIKNIRNKGELFNYGKTFNNYLNKYNELKHILLDDRFYNIYAEIISSEILGKKRHSGVMSFTETRKARELLIGHFEKKDCLIYMLLLINDYNY